MIDSKQLLSDLQKRVRLLEDDLRARCNAQAEVDAPLRKDYEMARDKWRTSLTYNAWREEELTQVAVAWVLAAVFIRFLEDNQLIEVPLLAGAEAARMKRAQDEHDMFFRQRPTASERDYFEQCFAEAAKLPGMTAFFDRRHNPLWRVGPSADTARNDRLFEIVGGDYRPQLFLKGDLVAVGRPGLSPAVAEAIANEKCRLVGAVVNVVDDSLSGADQTSYTWNLDQIGALHEIMQLASECGRVVVLTSDHGHVLDEGSRQVAQPLKETGDRYRMASGGVVEGECEVRGPRIKAATGTESLVVLSAPRLRYQGKRRGYHGGICPQEMVVPCMVLRSSNCQVPEGWEDLPPFEPEWWSPRTAAAPTPTIETRLPAPTKIAAKQPELFAAAPIKSSWMADLVASPTYADQTKAAVRGAPPVEQLTKFLSLLEQRNGTILRAHLAQQMGMATLRVDGLIQNYRRLLNVDGYDVLAYDPGSETVMLNIELLKNQFQI
jgi:hypothetical protein